MADGLGISERMTRGSTPPSVARSSDNHPKPRTRAPRSWVASAPRVEVNFVHPEPLTEAGIEGIEPQCGIGEELTRKSKSMLNSHIERFQMLDDA